VGIDIYLEWDGITEDDKKAQWSAGFSVTAGHLGYLREAYHGGPYATTILCREAFESETCRALIAAETLRARLTNVTEPAYTKNNGHNIAIQMLAALKSMGADIVGGTIEEKDTTSPMTVEEAIRERQRRVYAGDDDEDTDHVVQSFRNFVALAEQKERETGKPCVVYASH
jgi:hypothetical protein